MSSIPRLFVEEPFNIDNEIKILDKQYHYLHNVLRLNINDTVYLINGKDGEYLSLITFCNNKYIILKIISKTKEFCKEKFLGLIIPPIQKIDIVLKSATELGVSDFYFINTQYTNKANFKEHKIYSNIIEAIEQSERLDCPIIHKLSNIKNILDNINKDSLIFFCEERTGKNNIENILKYKNINTNIYALIGPEGGFTEDEKILINSYKNTISINLGNNILRTETATISILSLLKLINNNIA